MTKHDLVIKLAQKEGFTEKQASDIVKLFFDKFQRALDQDERIEIRGFGIFSVREYGSYTGRNPSTGKHVAVREKRLPYFKPGRELKTLIDT